MPRSERELREDLAPTTERAVASPPEVVAPMPAAVMRMQATAGNRATTELLARAPAKDKPKAAARYTMTIAKLGEFPLTSVQLGHGDRDDIVVTLGMSDERGRLHGPALTAVYPTVTIATSSVTITLTDVLISSIDFKDDPAGEEAVVTVALNASARKIK
jgi:hypothetical protein